MKWFEIVNTHTRSLARNLARFPWRNTALALRQRFKEDQLGLTASSLTFTTTLSLVPLLTVALALFTAFPMFATLQTVLQKWLLQSLIPDNIARQVLGYLTQFSSNASRLGLAGLVIVLTTALTLILTIDNTLNNIWRVKKPRSWAQRVLIYWAALTLGPLLLGASLTMTSYVLSLSSNAVGGGAGLWGGVVAIVQFGLFALGAAAMYRFVPNAEVKWAHAWVGGAFVAVGIELAKKLLALYLASVPTYAAVYGAFATFPILLLWIYVVWVIVLLGAVLAAYLPSLLAGVARRGGRPGWQFQLAIEVVQVLHLRAEAGHSGLPRTQIAAHLGVDKVQLEPVLEALLSLDWIGTLEATDTAPDTRLILLADPDKTLLSPLVSRLLIYPASAMQPFWASAGLAVMTVRGAMNTGHTEDALLAE
jgi:membrane protein